MSRTVRPAKGCTSWKVRAMPSSQIRCGSMPVMSRPWNSTLPAVGFWKPHLPFNPPRKYWEMYDRDEIDLPQHPERPADAPEVGHREHLGLELPDAHEQAVPAAEPRKTAR